MNEWKSLIPYTCGRSGKPLDHPLALHTLIEQTGLYFSVHFVLHYVIVVTPLPFWCFPLVELDMLFAFGETQVQGGAWGR